MSMRARGEKRLHGTTDRTCRPLNQILAVVSPSPPVSMIPSTSSLTTVITHRIQGIIEVLLLAEGGSWDGRPDYADSMELIDATMTLVQRTFDKGQVRQCVQTTSQDVKAYELEASIVLFLSNDETRKSNGHALLVVNELWNLLLAYTPPSRNEIIEYRRNTMEIIKRWQQALGARSDDALTQRYDKFQRDTSLTFATVKEQLAARQILMATKLEAIKQQMGDAAFEVAKWFDVKPMEGFGNCMFASIGSHIGKSSTQVRRELVEYHRQRSKMDPHYLVNNGINLVDIARHGVSNVGGGWGGEPELAGAAELYTLVIVTYEMVTLPSTSGVPRAGRVVIRTPPAIGKNLLEKEVLYLRYQNLVHYDVLKLKPGTAFPSETQGACSWTTAPLPSSTHRSNDLRGHMQLCANRKLAGQKDELARAREEQAHRWKHGQPPPPRHTACDEDAAHAARLADEEVAKYEQCLSDAELAKRLQGSL